MITYTEATTTQSATQIQTQLYADLDAEGVTITGFSPTSAERGLVALDARALAYHQAIRAEVVKSVLLVDPQQRDEAWIDRKIKGFFGITRLLETKARHIFVLTNQTITGGPHEIKPNRLEVSADDGTLFRNVTGGILGTGIGTTLPLEFEAVNPGLSGNIAPGQVFAIRGGSIPGVDVSNAPDSLIFAARARETNSEYVARALARWGTLAAGGHPSAVEFRILSGVETITKVGVRDDNPNGPGSVDVYLANASGPATLDECAAAEAVFGPYEPLGSRGLWRYLPAVARTVTVEAVLELDGENDNALADAEDALDLLAAQWPMRAGELLDETLVGGIIRGGAFEKYALPGFRGVKDAEITAPLDNVTLLVGEVLVFDVVLTEA